MTSVDTSLTIRPELEANLNTELNSVRTEIADFREVAWCAPHDVPVPGGTIRVYHIAPPEPISTRPAVFVSGWGSTPEDFSDMYAYIHGTTELYYIESREKRSSVLKRFRSDMSVSQKARDLATVIDYFHLNQIPDYVLYGTCWGSAIILQALIDNIISPPTCVAQDPMHSLWFPKWFLRFVAPWLPTAGLAILRPILKKTMFGDMEQPVQKARTIRFIDDAVLWKWKRAAVSARNFELYGNLKAIKTPVVIVNGTWDKVHDQSHYPRITREIPGGKFLFMKTDESCRERLIGFVLREFSFVKAEDGVPSSLRPFQTI